MDNIRFAKSGTKTKKIGNITYGTLVTRVTGHPEVVYMKADKRNMGIYMKANLKRGFSGFSFPPSTSVLVDMKNGGLRVVRGKERVEVLEGELLLEKVEPRTHSRPHVKYGR